MSANTAVPARVGAEGWRTERGAAEDVLRRTADGAVERGRLFLSYSVKYVAVAAAVGCADPLARSA